MDQFSRLSHLRRSLLIVTLFIAVNSLPIVTQAGGSQRAAVTRLGSATYLGGTAVDHGRVVGMDAQGTIYVALDTFSTNINGTDFQNAGGEDILVVKLSPDSTEILGGLAIGGTSSDKVGGMAVTPQGEVVLAVDTSGTSFPLKNPLHDIDVSYNHGVVLKINAALDDLVFSTYTWTQVDPSLHNVAVDGAGNVTLASYYYSPSTRARNMVVQTYSPDGQQLLRVKNWANDTVDERPQAVVVQPNGTAYIAGYTESRHSDFAVTENALQKVCGRKLTQGSTRDCDNDAFVVRLTPNDDVDYASYLGGNGDDRAVGMAVDSYGAMYLLGSTTAQDFPTTAGALQPRCRVVQPEDGCYYDMFVAKLDADGSALAYSTYLASSDVSGLDYPAAIAVDAAGNATVVGRTASQQWPVKGAVQPTLNVAPCPNAFQDRLCFDSVATTFGPDGQLVFGSYVGGSFDEYSNDLALGTDGSMYMVGSTESADFPTTAGVAQPRARSGSDAFLIHFTATDTTPQPQPQGKGRVYLPFVRN